MRQNERKIVESDGQTGDSREREEKRNIEDIERLEPQQSVCKNLL